jgi:uncharacterized membrane protein YgcG
MLLSPASGAVTATAAAKRGAERQQREGPYSAAAAALAGSLGLEPPRLLPAPLLGATLHVLRTPHAAGRLAYLLLKASEEASAAARAQAEQQQEEERQRNASSATSKKQRKQKREHASGCIPPLSAFRLASEPLARIPGDDLPPAVTLAWGAVGPLFTATTATAAAATAAAAAASAQDGGGGGGGGGGRVGGVGGGGGGGAGGRLSRKKKKCCSRFDRWLVPAAELTAAAHGKARCRVGVGSGGSGGSGGGERADPGGQGGISSSRRGRRAPGDGADGGGASELDVSALLAGKVPPPPSWARFVDDLQGAQELATRGGARAGAGRGGEGGEEGAGEE